MKKLILIVCLLVTNITVAEAQSYIKMPVLGYLPTDMDYGMELVTTKFDKVILDCQSLRMGMSFSNNGEIKSDIFLDMFQCEDMMAFLNESHSENLPVCIELDSAGESLTFSRETDECL